MTPFTTVESVPKDQEPPSFWNQIDLDSYLHRVFLDPDLVIELQDNWFTHKKLGKSHARKCVPIAFNY